MKFAVSVLVIALWAATGLAQTTRPTTQPASDPNSASPDNVKKMTADRLLDQMLKPDSNPSRPLDPISDRPVRDKSSAAGALKPGAPPVNVQREGTFIIDRLGRLTRGANNQAEFTFESDGKALKDPPLIILPNLKLMQMEDAVTGSSRDLQFRVTGMLTEYRGRNYILLEKVLVVPDVTQQF